MLFFHRIIIGKFETIEIEKFLGAFSTIYSIMLVNMSSWTCHHGIVSHQPFAVKFLKGFAVGPMKQNYKL